MSVQLGSTLDAGGLKIISLADPTSAQDAATKAYVDTLLNGLSWKAPARTVATTNVNTASPGAAIGGVTLANGERVLLTGQTTAAQNGLYVFNGSGSALTRATDADSAAELVNMAVPIEEGTGADTIWMLTTNLPITVGTTALTITQLPLVSYTAGNGLSLTGTVFAVLLDTSSGLIVSGTGLKIDTATVVRKYAATIGDGAATSYAVTHNLGTTDPIVQVYETGGSKRRVIVEIQITDANNVTVVFATAPASGAYRVVVHA